MILSLEQTVLEDAMFVHYGRLSDTFDKQALHVSDLVQCVRAVWYRRNGYAEEPITPSRRLTMVRGIAIEKEIREGLAATLTRRGCEVYHETSDYGIMTGWLSSANGGDALLRAQNREINGALTLSERAATGHIDLCAVNDDIGEAVVVEIKSMPFLGPAALTKHVIQAAGYELMVALALPDYSVRSYVVEVSAVTGEHRLHRFDTATHAAEVLHRLEEREWVTAPGDEMPEPSIPDEQFVERGRKPNKKLVNLLCEKYCGFRMCPDNHVGEEAALADE
jgi:CRISPR/Cas system-associated exonuclease Cas4 (RecB family)